MKKVKIMLSTIIVVAIVGSGLAFKAYTMSNCFLYTDTNNDNIFESKVLDDNYKLTNTGDEKYLFTDIPNGTCIPTYTTITEE